MENSCNEKVEELENEVKELNSKLAESMKRETNLLNLSSDLSSKIEKLWTEKMNQTNPPVNTVETEPNTSDNILEERCPQTYKKFKTIIFFPKIITCYT